MFTFSSFLLTKNIDIGYGANKLSGGGGAT
jgi:hypothetical protein